MDEKFKITIKSLAKEFKAKKVILFDSAIAAIENARDIDSACEGI